MSFHNWLKEKHDKTWEELFCKVSDIALIEYAIDYEIYCSANNIKPSWT